MEAAVNNLKRVIEFVDRMKAPSNDGKIVIEAEHWALLEQAARDVAVAADLADPITAYYRDRAESGQAALAR